MKLCSDSQCERKGEMLPLIEFSIRRREKDGLNIYCRPCTRRRNAEYRERTLLESVLNAIDRGRRTREEIEVETGESEDLIADAIAILWDRNKIRIVEGRYFPRAKAA